MSAPAGDGRCGRGCHRRVGSRPLKSVDDDLLSFLEAINNASRLRRHLAETHPALPGDILIVHDIHVTALLIGEDGGARHGDDLLRLHGFRSTVTNSSATSSRRLTPPAVSCPRTGSEMTPRRRNVSVSCAIALLMKSSFPVWP